MSKSETQGGFPKGTRILTRAGKKAVEAVQPGDEVLARAPDGSGPTEWKPVLRVVQRAEAVLRALSTPGPESGTEYPLTAAADQELWVDGRGWYRADEVPRILNFVDKEGVEVQVLASDPIFKTPFPGIGWVPNLSNYEESDGRCFNYAEFQVAPDEQKCTYLPAEIFNSPQRYLRVPVYQLQVKDHGTYYAGASDIWARGIVG